MKGLDVFVILLLFLTLGLGVYILIESLPGKTVQFESQGNSVGGNYSQVYANQGQFYPNMRYPDRIITYSVSDSCNAQKKLDIDSAFSILENKTILKFDKISANGQIDFLCSNISPSSTDKDHFVAGEGGPVDVFISGKYYVIMSGKVSLYRDEKCSTPQIAIHEILHALGFDHNNNQKSIMYPVTSCDETVDSYISDEINLLYADYSYADLIINNADASKAGKYMDFSTQISNIGLKDAKDVTLHLYAGNTEVKNISLGDLPIGSKKRIDGKDVTVPKDAATIRMIVSIGAGQRELNLNNNELELNVISS
ncbi:MAG: matrixin family metalloprotease [archaeon]